MLDLSYAETEANTISVVESTSIPSNVEYMSLSHCWGSKPVISLSQTNFESLKSGISISDLPKTFQDSITVAGWFQCKYLWIDSLCIIQDCIEDWRKENADMRHVYKNAWLNVAATGAPDSSFGLFSTGTLLLSRLAWSQCPGMENYQKGPFVSSCAMFGPMAWVEPR